MSNTIVGLFHTPAEAQRVRQVLIQEGLAASNLRILSNETDGFAEAAVTDAGTTTSGQTGIVASIKNFFRSLTNDEGEEQEYYTRGVSAGGALLAVTVDDEQVESVASLLEAQGAQDVTEEGTPKPASATAARSGVATNEAIPVVKEDLQVGKRQVARGGVRVYSRVIETPVEEAVQLREEQVRVQRTPVDRPASATDFETGKDGSIEVTETGEEVVVSKQARVVEEVTVGKDVTERTESVKDTLRHTEVDVEEVPGEVSQKAQSARKL
jgi:uncharacterized protein (TIGR02271 family)